MEEVPSATGRAVTCPSAEAFPSGAPTQAWAPQDVGEYLRRATTAYRNDPGWGHYNEFLLDGLAWDLHLPDSIEAFLTNINHLQ